MVELRVLGGVSLKGLEGGDPSAILSHPKRVAVLSYLALAASDTFVSRDQLVALFWPEADESRARNALSQILHALRTELGEGVLQNRGRREVRLSPHHFRCDAGAFLEAIRSGRNETALNLYSGHLLEGFHLGNAPEFDQWLSEERGRLREMAARAAWAVAHDHIRAGGLVDAERTGQRALGLVCTDESEARRFIHSLAMAGDRAGAIQFFERFRLRLEQELELEPSPRTMDLVSRLRESPEAVLADEIPGGGPDPAGSWPQVKGGKGGVKTDLPGRESVSLPGPDGSGFPQAGRDESDVSDGNAPVRSRFGGRLLPWALACLAGGWATSEAATFMVDRFDWPEPVGQVASLLIVMAAFGFFFALILAFYFGEKARGQATGTELLVVAVAMLATGSVLSRTRTERAVQDLIGVGGGPVAEATMLLLPWAAGPVGGDLTVYEGIRSELVERLSREGWLRIVPVDAPYPGFSPTPGAGGVEAEVDFFLEIGVIEEGDRLRFTSRLLAPGTGEPVWIGEVERTRSDDLLAGVGAEMAEAVAVGVRERRFRARD